MPGDYTTEELQSMPREEFEAAVANGFARLTQPGTTVNFPVPDGSALVSTAPSQIQFAKAAPAPNPNAWAAKKDQESDFTCPSGQTCRLRRIGPEELLEHGILDRVTRLDGLAAELVDTAEGAPPKAAKMPTREEIASLLDVVNTIVPIAVVEPKVYRNDDADAPSGAIRVSDIDLEDRMAILEESTKGLRALDRFRDAG